MINLLKTRIRVAVSSCSIDKGAREVLEELKKQALNMSVEADLKEAGCFGFCFAEPTVALMKDNHLTIYGKANEGKSFEDIIEHLSGKKPISEFILFDSNREDSTLVGNRLLSQQSRIAMQGCGLIASEDIEDYLSNGGFRGLNKALSMDPSEIINEIKSSGLRGKGGAGFQTGMKWDFARKATGSEKYVVCNADEGDVGTYVDRTLLEGLPFRIVESMAICGYTIGANKGYIYIRTEYPLSIFRMQNAIEQARRYGYLGKKILGLNFDFELEVRQGAGSYVCGEETALLESIEGKRGYPRIRPPYPANIGLFGKPTNVNNVETLASIPWIIINRYQNYRSIGTELSPGTKMFSSDKTAKFYGVVEVPFGITLSRLVNELFGGRGDGDGIKAVLIGGTLGAIVPASMFETPIGYEELSNINAVLGSGGLCLIGNNENIAKKLNEIAKFNREESCGKCFPCRIGTKRLEEFSLKMKHGKISKDMIESLKILYDVMAKSSLCGHGQGAGRPFMNVIDNFHDEIFSG
jgi:NADH-quinone oxidoreductase subunit F